MCVCGGVFRGTKCFLSQNGCLVLPGLATWTNTFLEKCFYLYFLFKCMCHIYTWSMPEAIVALGDGLSQQPVFIFGLETLDYFCFVLFCFVY